MIIGAILEVEQKMKKIKFIAIPDELANYIREYESDTFSAQSTKINENESRAIAHFFLNRWARGGDIGSVCYIDIVADKLGIDGLQIDEILSWFRDGELSESEINL